MQMETYRPNLASHALAKFLTLPRTPELAQQRKKKGNEEPVWWKGALILFAHHFRWAKPVFAFLVKWPCGQSCLRASENIFANFFCFKKVSAPRHEREKYLPPRHKADCVSLSETKDLIKFYPTHLLVPKALLWSLGFPMIKSGQAIHLKARRATQ